MHLPVDARFMFGPPKPSSLFVLPMRWRRLRQARANGSHRGRLGDCSDKLVPYAAGMTESTGSTSTVDVFSALIADWNEAVVANDPDAIAAFAEPDWVFVGENGTFPGEQFLEAVATGQVSHDFMTSEVHDVRVYGDVAIVIARVRNRGEFKGNPFTLDEWSSDVFVRRGDRWRCSVTHLTSVAAATPAT